MKLRDYIEQLNLIAEENPDVLEYDVIYSSDDEGNDYQKIHYGPSIGYYEDREFRQYDEDYEPNAVCIN